MENQRLQELFEKEGSIAIVVGATYTLDEMAGALSLYLGLSAKGKDVSIVSTKQPLVEVSNLVGINRVKSQIESKSGDLIVSFPYQNNEIGKVSYTLEEGYLNIIVKPKENQLSFSEKDVIYRRTSEAPSVIIAVGVKRLSELSAFFNVENLKDTTIVNIDKQGNNEGYGDVVIINQKASSVSEQIADLFINFSYPMDQDMAQNLMSGLTFATKNFQSSRTSSLAFEMAGILLRNGAKREIMSTKQPRPGRQMRDLQRSQRQAQYRPGNQPRPQGQQPVRVQNQPNQAEDAPSDWLAPKIFKGSTNVE